MEREVEFEGIRFSIRSLERSRVAGWGVEIINRVDKSAGRELKQTGWVWLVGDEPPCEDSARIAAGHPDVEIRSGAAHTHEELLEIAGWLGDRTGITREWEIYCMIQSVGVNMPANGIYIVINLRFDGTRESTGLCFENSEWSSDDDAIEAKRKEVRISCEIASMSP